LGEPPALDPRGPPPRGRRRALLPRSHGPPGRVHRRGL